MADWDEIRTAFEVARFGTVSGAAAALGVHHATVIRRVDALEGKLGAKLFQRHARGYAATEAGQELLRVASEANDRFLQLASRIKGQGPGLEGELVVTSLSMLSPHLGPILAAFSEANPGVLLRFLTGERIFRLEAGEAHVAVRARQDPPGEPDFVVQPLARLPVALVASEAYAARHGLPATEADLAAHRFAGFDGADGRAPYNAWLAELVPRERVTFRASEDAAMRDAILGGAGIGFMARIDMAGRAGLHEVLPARDGWVVPLWLVTHVDLHRAAKVQALLAFLKERARAWG